MNSANKIQHLLITHLSKYGSIKLLLPDNIEVEIGINQLAENDELVNTKDYSWVTTTKDDKMTILDSYDVGLRFDDDKKYIVFEDQFINTDGKKLRRLDVV